MAGLNGGQLLRLDVRCSVCGEAPRIRVTPQQVAKWKDHAPGTVTGTYQCHGRLAGGRWCNTIYAISAGAYQRATT